MENSERGSENKLPKGFKRYDPIGSDATIDRALIRKLRNEDKFPHRLFPGKEITSIEELLKHEWVYIMPWHKAQHVSVVMSGQARTVVAWLIIGLIREALEMTDQEVIDEKNIGNRAAYLARVEYRERLFDHAGAIHDSMASVPDYSADQSPSQTAKRPAN